MNFFSRNFFNLFVGVAFINYVPNLCLAASVPKTNGSFHSASNGNQIPEEEVVVAFAGQAMLEFPGGYGEGRALVSDRILDGFEAAPASVKLNDGTMISSGFKYKEANFESLVVADSEGKLRLLGAVTDITRLTSSYRQPISTIEEYKEKIKKSMSENPSVILFVRDEHDLVTYLPVVKRWVQADLLGGNADCENVALVGACKLAQEINIPIAAYLVVNSQSSQKEATRLRALSVPDLPPASTPIKLFK